jgi:hypothetical protein
MTIDIRFLSAARDPMRARQVLNELHQKIRVTRAKSQMSELLARYVALATRLASPPPSVQTQYQDLQVAMGTLSQIMKQSSDNLKALVSNLKA